MWTVYLRDPNRERQAQIDDYSSLEAIPRFNAVGAWSITMDMRHSYARQMIAAPQWGIELVHDATQTTVITGRAVKATRKRSTTENTVTVYGVDDMTWLTRRVAHPQPATGAPPYSTQAYDVRTGTCSTILRQYVDVNAGPGALAQRAVPGLSLDTDPVIGTSVTGRARWQDPLLTLLQELALAGGGLGFRVRKSGANLLFQVYQPVDRSASVIFSEELGNLSEFSYELVEADVNYVYVGGGGEGTARTIREGQRPDGMVEWGRIERFLDRRDTTVTTELDQAISERLQEGRESVIMSVTPIDTDGQTYLTHYDLGDKVTVLYDDFSLADIVREVKIQLTPEKSTVSPTVGTPGARAQEIGSIGRMRKLETRVNSLERR
jgi:hypothetical protein